MFITFEGIDFSGKTTQAGLAVERLVSLGKRVKYVREPGGTELSERIRAILLDKTHIAIDPIPELLLFNAARAQLVREVIVPSLRDGTIVVCDRFYDSTTAYQGYGRDLPLGDVGTINRFATGGNDAGPHAVRRRGPGGGPTAEAQGREHPDRMERSGDEFYAKVAQGYRRIAGDEPERVVVIRGTGTVEETHAAIWNAIARKLNITKDIR